MEEQQIEGEDDDEVTKIENEYESMKTGDHSKDMKTGNHDYGMKPLYGRVYPSDEKDEDHEGESEEVNEQIAVEMEGMEIMDEADDEDNNAVGCGEDEEIKVAHVSWRR